MLLDLLKGTYEAITMGNPVWNQLSVPSSTLYSWDSSSTYIQEPPYYGSIHKNSPAAKFLLECGVNPKDFNSYGNRRDNDEVIARGTFANICLFNKLSNRKVSPKTIHIPS